MSIRIANDSFELIKNFFSLNNLHELVDLLNYVKENNKNEIVELFYKYYTLNIMKDNKLEEFQELYLDQIDIASDLFFEEVRERFFYLFKRSGYFHYFSSSVNYGKNTKYRLYCNIKINKIIDFSKAFIKAIRLLKSKGIELKFQFKIMNAHSKSVKKKFSFMRREKFVFYFEDFETLKKLCKLFYPIKSYFDESTQIFTHEIFPGLGYSFHPGNDELLEHTKILGLSKSGVSFGEYMAGILTSAFIKATKEVPEIFEQLGKLHEYNYHDQIKILENIAEKIHIRMLSIFQTDKRYQKVMSFFSNPNNIPTL